MHSDKILKTIINIVLFASLLTPALCIGADIQYVSDVLIITLREGPSNKHKRVKTLKTDSRLEVLEKKGRYLYVRTSEGVEGWVLKQYVSSKTPKAQIITNLKKKMSGMEETLQRLKDRNARLETEVKNLQTTHAKTQKTLEVTETSSKDTMMRTKGQLDQMTQRYNTLLNQSKHVVELTDENEALLSSNNKLNKELEYLQQENTHLKRSGMMKWFLAGGGVLLAGFVAGKMGSSKKKYY